MKKILFVTFLSLALSSCEDAPSKTVGNALNGQNLATSCVGCHGQQGVSLVPIYPSLAGKEPDYLVNALSRYKSGLNTNPIMRAQVAGLTEKDILDLAAYYSSIKQPN